MSIYIIRSQKLQRFQFFKLKMLNYYLGAFITGIDMTQHLLSHSAAKKTTAFPTLFICLKQGEPNYSWQRIEGVPEYDIDFVL